LAEALIARDLADASLAGLSTDRRFATADNAALQAANMAIACAGYRIVSKVGHHRVSLDSTKLVLGKSAHKYADYFETCRRKRNTIDYTFSNVATETEAKEILVQANDFYSQIEGWITKNHPTLKK
jgi:allantoicase